jgi:hypothetical membrane protein
MNKFFTYGCRFLIVDMLIFYVIGLFIKEQFKLYAYSGAFMFFVLTVIVYIYGAILGSAKKK